MRNRIGKFFSRIRQWMFNWRVEREIYLKIFPQMNKEADHGYPFSTKDELVRKRIRARLEIVTDLGTIGLAAAKMPEAYGEAFQYIVYRDLYERMEMYMELAEKRLQTETCDPDCVATRA